MSKKTPEIRFDGFTDDWELQLPSGFFAELLLNNLNRKQIKRRVSGNSILSSDLVPIPSISEQKKIEKFFKQINKVIALHERELENLKKSKDCLFQKMFPKGDEHVPEIRFSGFFDEWKSFKLSTMINYKNGKGHEGRLSDSGKYELININSISKDGDLIHSGKFVNDSLEILKKNDLVMVLSDIGNGDLLGKVALISENDKFVLNQRVALLRPNDTVSPLFMLAYINQHQRYFKLQGVGISQLNISRGSIENFESFVPCLEEQEKIGLFFKQFDDTISLHHQQLNILIEAKKALLQKMFV